MASKNWISEVKNKKEDLQMRKSPGAYEDAVVIAKQQGAKTGKQISTQAKQIVQNRINDASKNLTRAKMQDKSGKLLRGTTKVGKVSGTKSTAKSTTKSTTKKVGKK